MWDGCTFSMPQYMSRNETKCGAYLRKYKGADSYSNSLSYYSNGGPLCPFYYKMYASTNVTNFLLLFYYLAYIFVQDGRQKWISRSFHTFEVDRLRFVEMASNLVISLGKYLQPTLREK